MLRLKKIIRLLQSEFQLNLIYKMTLSFTEKAERKKKKNQIKSKENQFYLCSVLGLHWSLKQGNANSKDVPFGQRKSKDFSFLIK